MRRAMNLLALLAVLASSLSAAQAQPVGPSDPNATPETAALLAGLQRIRGEKMLFGHHMTDTFVITNPPAGADRWSDVKAATGEWPGMWSYQMNFATRFGAADSMRESIRFAHELGAPVTMCWHMGNPVTGGGSGDTNIDIASILPGGANHHLLVAEMSRGADYLETLTDSQGQPIPVLYRPWHEFNLVSAFWWNLATPAQFKQLWQFTVEYYRDTRGLHNLLYVWNPNWRKPMSEGDIRANLLEKYPGDAYVDVLGLDHYGDINKPGVMEVLREIVRLADERGKLPTLHETGVSIGSAYANPYADPDWYIDLLTALKGDPLTATIPYVTTWYNKPSAFWVPYAEGVNGYEAFMEFYNDPWTGFSGDLPALNLYSRLAGDVDLDGRVDDADLNLLLSAWGQTGQGWTGGDLTGDGAVDDRDLSVLLSHWGDSVAVPEPASLVLWALAALGLARHR